MTIALLFLSSCRQDLLPEKETYRNTSAFQLASKRISLDEAKHKVHLTAELEKAKKTLKTFSKNNVQGKIVNYGNGFSVDTDNVTYIENGPNFHTYTFNLTRDNALPADPVENLVLVPMTDGTYKELLVTYNLTEAEKQILLEGGFVNTQGKTEVTAISTGNYSSVLGKGQSCGFETTTYYTSCTSGEHMPGEDGCTLKGSDRATIYTVTNYVCTNIYDGTETGGGGEYYGSGGGTDSGTGGEQLGPGTTQPCNGSGVSTNPLDPNTNISEGGCSGIPTVVTVPNPADDPCVKTSRSISAANTVLKNPTVQSQMDAVLKGKRTLENEWATALGIKSDGSYDITPAIEQQQNSGNSPDDLLSNPASFFADGHTHSGDPAKPSAGDLYGMLNEVFYNANFKYRYVYGDSDIGTPEVYAMVLNDRAAAIQFRGTYLESKNYDIDKQGFLKGSTLWKEFEKIKALYDKISTVNTSGEDYHPKAVAMAYLLENLNAGISVAKVDNNGNLKKINVILEEITNPDGTKGQRVKVSKCP